MQVPFLIATALALSLGQSSLRASESVDYLKEVKPLLAARCYACHGGLQQKGDLRVDTAHSLRDGGKSGPAVVPGRAAESLLLAHVTASAGKRRMPPTSEGEGLSPKEIALLRAWIDQGANGPADEKPEADPRAHWAFRSPVRPTLPRLRDGVHARNPIDVFLVAERDKHGVTTKPAAERAILLRRVYLDLIGLPPSREELAAFVADPAPDAYEKVVERLLASPQYGERWGRHWMDVWRYSDWWGLGAEVRNSQKHIWHWRDWIIESLNADKSYAQMVREMLAADEFYPNDLDRLRATGFLARQYFKFNRNSWLDETIEHTSKAFLGLTINCAKCHDHKFDPIAQTDYYRLRAFFEPYQIRMDRVPGETDVEKDGIPRAFDCNLDAATYRFIQGDEKRPMKARPLSPGVPPVLAFGALDIRPVSLPREAHSPGLRPFVLDDDLRLAEKQIQAARANLEQARKALAEVKRVSEPAASSPPQPPQAGHQPRALSLIQASGPASAAQKKALAVEQARAFVVVAERALAAAQAQPVALEARAAADRAQVQNLPASAIRDQERRAAVAERQAAAAQAEEALARAELELLQAAAGKKAVAKKKRTAARDAVTKARKALVSAGETYTPVSGALKTLESNVETEASRNKPFPTTSTGRRSALAYWITDERHPLTARVTVNHVWAWHFGKPLVATVFDFGRKGAAPTHPQLLDWLAVELREHDWSLKHLHRLMVTSEAYRLTSSSAGAAAANQAIDPENRYYSRMNSTRMEAEVLRDSLLHLAGMLDPAMGGPPLDPVKQEASRRRSLYFVHSHNDEHHLLSMFDEASVLECYRRQESIVPQQALALSNSKFALGMAAHINTRLHERLGTASDAEFVGAAFETMLASPPTAEERAECARAVRRLTDLLKLQGKPDAVRRARADLVLALLNHNDFVTIR